MSTPETLCSGCGATVTKRVRYYRDVAGRSFCPATGFDKRHYVKLELPPVAIAPETQHTPVAKPLHDLFPSLIGSELLPEAQEAAIEWVNLYCEAAELEDHDCPNEDFRVCSRCEQINEMNSRARSVEAVWQKHWAAGFLHAFDLLAALKAAKEEIRLIRMKDCNVVYNPCLQSMMSLAISRTEGGKQ